MIFQSNFNGIWWIEFNIRALVLLNLLNSLRKRDKKCSTSLAFYLISPTRVIYSIKHKHSCKILFIVYHSLFVYWRWRHVGNTKQFKNISRYVILNKLTLRYRMSCNSERLLWLSLRSMIFIPFYAWRSPNHWRLRLKTEGQKVCWWYEPVHEIINNVVCATSKASDQAAHAVWSEPLLVAWVFYDC